MKFSAVVSQTSIRGETSGVVAKSVLTLTNICMKLCSILGRGSSLKKRRFSFFSLFFVGLHSRIFIGRWSSRWIEKQRKRSIFQPRRYLWLAFEVGNFYIFRRSDRFCEINELVFFDHLFQRFLCWFEVSWRWTRQDRWTFYPVGR